MAGVATRALAPGSRWRAPAELIAVVAIAAVAGLGLAYLGNADDQLKVVVAGLGGCAMVAGALHPVFGLGMLMVLIPFEFRLTVGETETGTNELLVVGLALAIAWRIRWSEVPRSVVIGGLGLILGNLASGIVAEDAVMSTWGGLRWLAIMALLWTAFSVLRPEHRPMDRLLEIIGATGAVVAFFALLQKVGITVLVGPSYFAEQPDSFFGYYTNFAGFMAFCGLLCAGEVLHRWTTGDATRALLFGGTLSLVLLATISSTSRGGLLSLAAGFAVFIILSLRRGALGVRVLGVLAVFGAVAVLATPADTRTEVVGRFDRPFGTTVSDRQRFALQEGGRRIVQEDPLGIGYRNFEQWMKENIRNRYITYSFAHAHQTPTMMGVEGGWLGLVGFFVLAVTPFWLAFRRFVDGTLTVRGIAVVAAATGFLAQSTFDYLFYEITFPVVFAALIWLAWWELGPRRAAAAS